MLGPVLDLALMAGAAPAYAAGAGAVVKATANADGLVGGADGAGAGCRDRGAG